MAQPGVIHIDETETKDALDTPWNVTRVTKPNA